jgi:hypothetical protein
MFGTIPYGVEDLRVSPVTGSANTVGTAVDVTGIRGFSFNVESDVSTLDGDNRRIAIARGAKSLTGDMELGQFILEALAVFSGGTITSGGTSGTLTKELSETDDTTARYFQAHMAAPSQDAGGSEYQAKLRKLMLTSGPDEGHVVNDWSNPTLSFEGLSVGGVLLTRYQYETEEGLDA